MKENHLVDQVRTEADVVLALGTRFGETDWWGKAPKWGSPDEQTLIQVDVENVKRGIWFYKCTARVDGKLAVSADITCAPGAQE